LKLTSRQEVATSRRDIGFRAPCFSQRNSFMQAVLVRSGR
jgi:hypothetical protein